MPIQGGYDVTFEKDLDEKYVCPLCKKALREPVQTQCGHRFCSTCIDPILRNPNPQCPLDKEPLSQREVLKDVCCQHEVLTLICYCINRKYGCEWKKELLYLEEHLNNCEYREVPCLNEGCEEIRIPLKKLDQHMKESCRYKQSTCQHCGQEIMMEDHLQRCEKLPITCQYCGMTDILHENEKDNIEEHCEAAEKACKYKYVGCLFKGNLDDLNQHCDNQTAEHLRLTKKTEEELKRKLEKVEKESEKLEKQFMAGHVEILGDRFNKAVKTEQIRERTERSPEKKRKISFG